MNKNSPGLLFATFRQSSGGLAGVLAQFKSDGAPGFLLPNRRTIRRIPAGGDIFDPNDNDITAAKLAVDRPTEHGEVASVAFDLEFRPNRPDVFRSRRRLCTGRVALSPNATCTD
ncbi:MAG TPA: hypothetical protein VK777_17670 [Reyranella sp.]|nr:hypothetical protein [Reyranella sp.]